MLTLTDKETKKQISVYPSKDYKYGSKNQKRRAESISAQYILVTGDNRGRLPDWVKRILKTEQMWFKKIGGTTFVSNVFALYYSSVTP